MRTQTVVGVLCAVVFFHLVSRMARANAISKCKLQESAFQKALQGHTYDTFKVNSLHVCVKRCDKEEKCQSINFVIDESICELNKQSKEARPDNYVTDPRRIYMTVQFGKDTWPSGTYGLPRSKTGCPQPPHGSEWETGWRVQDTENSNNENGFSDSFHLDAVVLDSHVNRSFCIKHVHKVGTGAKPWPLGQYCIYKKGTCPVGLSEGFIQWDDEDTSNKNSNGGTLPDGTYDHTTRISFCCQTDGNKSDPITLPVEKPFYLLAYGSSECQKVEGALGTEEYIQYDNENSNNYDKLEGSHPFMVYSDDTKMRITYCYYRAA